MDKLCKLTNLNIPIINVIKCLLVAACFTLAAPVFADSKQDILGTCTDNYLADDFNSALPSCTKAAEQGHAQAQIDLGNMHAYGKGTPQDDKQAVYWHTKAAE